MDRGEPRPAFTEFTVSKSTTVQGPAVPQSRGCGDLGAVESVASVDVAGSLSVVDLRVAPPS